MVSSIVTNTLQSAAILSEIQSKIIKKGKKMTGKVHRENSDFSALQATFWPIIVIFPCLIRIYIL